MNENTDQTPKDRIQEEFEALPLDKKLASLFKMEAATLSEAFTYVVDSSSKAFAAAGDVIVDIGSKVEAGFKQASDSCETKTNSGYEPPPLAEQKPKDPKGKKTN